MSFGIVSTTPFDVLTLRESEGGPQDLNPNGTVPVDREFFGKFYVVE